MIYIPRRGLRRVGRGPGVVTVPPPASPFFSDDFESGSLGGGTLNAEEPGVFSYYTGAGAVTATSPISGSHSFRMPYGPNGPLEEGGNQERRFWFGRTLTQLWWQFSLLVPSNFLHRTRGEGVINNKLWAIFNNDGGGGYAAAEVWAGAEYLRINDNESSYRPMSTRSDWDFVSGIGGTYYLPSGDRLISPSGPIIPGTACTLQWHYKTASGPAATDGVHELRINGALFHRQTGPFWNQLQRTVDDPTFKRGYLFGYSNSGFTDQTAFMMDNLVFYDTDPGWV